MDKKTQLDLYKTMYRIRKFEEQAIESFECGDIPGFVHLSIGQEATEAGASACLNDNDCITSTHRGHGHIISKGASLDKMMAELYAKADGYCHGKGGSMHISDINIGVLGANGMVGAGMPLATGGALAQKMNKSDNVTVCFFGDGASNEGLLHECMNFSAIHKLPLIFLCENNHYGISTSTKTSTATEDIAPRAAGFGIPYDVIDGNDAVVVYETVKKAVERARAGEGPSFIECKTYKHRGHFEGDTGDYRPQEEVDYWTSKEMDPIFRFEKYMADNGITEDEMKKIQEEVTEEIAAAVKFAEESETLPIEKTLEDVYSDIIEEGRPW